MKKYQLIVSSITLIIASVLIQALIKDSNTKLDIELIDFFSGFAMGIGIALLIFSFFKKK